MCDYMHLPYGAKKPEEIYDKQLQELGRRYPQYEGLDFKKLKEINYVQVPVEYRKYEKRGGFKTPTGKCELYSTIMQKNGYDPLPDYQEPPESPYSRPDLLKEYPYVLTTGGRVRNFFCSEHKQIPFLRKNHPWPFAEIHKKTAETAGITDGDWVVISTKRGSILQKATINDRIDERVVNCEYGWWYPEKGYPDFGMLTSNANVLTSMDEPLDPAMGTYQLRGLLCNIRKATRKEMESVIPG